VEDAGLAGIVEDSGAAAQAGAAIAAHVVSKSEARREQVESAAQAPARHAGIADEGLSWRRVGVHRGFLSRRIAGRREHSEPVPDLAPRHRRLVAEAIVQRQPRRDTKAILRVDAVKLVAIVAELAGALAEA